MPTYIQPQYPTQGRTGVQTIGGQQIPTSVAPGEPPPGPTGFMPGQQPASPTPVSPGSTVHPTQPGTWGATPTTPTNLGGPSTAPLVPPGPSAPTGNASPREAIAEQYFNEMQKATNPAYEASLRDATQRAAAQGSLGSGQLNTSYGNLALQRAQNLDTLQQQLQTQATEGTISDYQTALQQWLQETALQNQIAQGQATYGLQAAQAKQKASQSYQDQSSAEIAALQQMLQSITAKQGTPTVPPAGG